MATPRKPRPPRVDLVLEGAAERESALGRTIKGDAQRLLVELGLPRRELTLVLSDDAQVRALNLQWRGEDKATDVLSFPLDELDPAAPVPERGGSLGDIVFSVETVARDAASLGWATADLAAFLLVHGVLHLLGHDHAEDEDASAMKAAETRLFAALRPGLVRPPTPY